MLDRIARFYPYGKKGILRKEFSGRGRFYHANGGTPAGAKSLATGFESAGECIPRGLPQGLPRALTRGKRADFITPATI